MAGKWLCLQILGVQALQAKVAALESQQNARVSAVVNPETSDPMVDSDLVMLQAGMPLVAAAPLHIPTSASAALDTPSGSPLLGQPVPKPGSQVCSLACSCAVQFHLFSMAVRLLKGGLCHAEVNSCCCCHDT